MAIYDASGNPLFLSEYANVMDYGAYGNGRVDDADAIQAAVDSLRVTGGVIYFPQGTYLLSKAIIFYSRQMLWFANGATLLQSGTMNNIIRAYMDSNCDAYNGVHDSVIYGGTFDAGENAYQSTLAGVAHCKNIIFENCTFKNGTGSWHDLEICASYNVKVINCDFEAHNRDNINGEMIQIDGGGGSYPWGGFVIDNTVSQYIDISGCIFHDSTKAPAIGTHTDMAHKFIRIHDNIFDGITTTHSAIYFTSSVSDVDIHDNTFNNCTDGIGSEGSTYYIHDNRFVDVTTAIRGSTSVVHDNMINGAYVA